MKRKGAVKKIGIIVAAFFLSVTVFPGTGRIVCAAGPSSDRFVPAGELLTYNTAKPQSSLKLCFGKGDQQWWIAGSQKDNTLVLFAADSCGEKQKFSDAGTKPYETEWACNYEAGSEPQEVSANHYGASQIRAAVSELERSYFTPSEQALMNETLLYNEDVKNSRIYSVSDRLYLAYADPETELVTVGANDKNDLKGGLTVDPSYFNSVLFGTRTPNVKENFASAGSKLGSMSVLVYHVDNDTDILPAFELDVSSVLFGSAVPAASADGAVRDREAVTLRYKGDIGQAVIDASQKEVTISDVTDKNQDIYLVIQSSGGAWAKKVSANDQLTVRELTGNTLTSLKDCKVWLETTDFSERMTYAAFARISDQESPQQTEDPAADEPETPTAEQSDVPETGSNSDYLLWIAALCLASAAIAFSLRKRMKD